MTFYIQIYKLICLDDYEHISVEEREVLLSEIYNLLHPEKVHASEEDLTKIKSPTDKKKYYAAIELAQNKSASLPRSTSVFTLPSHHSSTRSSSSSSQPSPVFKPRHKSESGVEPHRTSKLSAKLSDTKKRKTLPKVRRISFHNFVNITSVCLVQENCILASYIIIISVESHFLLNYLNCGF